MITSIFDNRSSNELRICLFSNNEARFSAYLLKQGKHCNYEYYIIFKNNFFIVTMIKR